MHLSWKEIPYTYYLIHIIVYKNSNIFLLMALNTIYRWHWLDSHLDVWYIFEIQHVQTKFLIFPFERPPPAAFPFSPTPAFRLLSHPWPLFLSHSTSGLSGESVDYFENVSTVWSLLTTASAVTQVTAASISHLNHCHPGLAVLSAFTLISHSLFSTER